MRLGLGIGVTQGGCVSLSALASGIQAFYPVAEAAGNAKSALTGGSDLVAVNNPLGVATTGGVMRQLVSANGTQLTSANTGLFTIGDTFTIALDVYFDSITSNQDILTLWDGTHVAYVLGYDTSAGLQFTKGNAAGTQIVVSDAQFSDSNAVATGVRYRIVVRCDGTWLKVSVNAGPESRIAWTSGVFSTPNQFVIGGFSTVKCDCRVANLGVWPRDIGSDWVTGLNGDGSTWAGYPFTGVSTGPRIPFIQRQDKIFTDGTQFVEFPIATKLSNGTIDVFYYNGAGDETAPGKVQRIRSTDGVTWGAVTTFETDAVNPIIPSAPEIELANGDLLRFTRSVGAGGASVETQYRSTDGGATWDGGSVLDTFGYALGVNRYGRAFQLESGTIIMPVYATHDTYTSGGHSDAFLIVSTDNGVTWTQGGMIFDGSAAGPTPGCYTETTIVRTGATTLRAVARQEHLLSGVTASSTDNGLTWSGPVSLGFIATSPALHYTPDGVLLLGAINSIRASVDGGNTWGPPHGVADSDRGYITMMDSVTRGRIDIYSSRTVTIPSTSTSLHRTQISYFEATTATAVAGSGQNVVTWTPVEAAASYSLKRGTVSGGPYTTIYTGTALTFTDTGLTNGTEYFYVVQATNSPAAPETAITLTSAEVNATPVAPPQTTILNNLAPVWTMEGAASTGETDQNAGTFPLAQTGGVGSVAGKFGNARQTTIATQNYLSSTAAGLSTGSQPFEIVLWIKPRAVAGQTIVSKYLESGASGEWECWTDATHINFACDGVASIVQLPIADLPTNSYSMLSVGYDGANAFIIVNASTAATQAGAFSITNSAAPFALGLNTASGAYWSSTDYDTVAMWLGRPLTNLERTWYFNGGAGRQWDSVGKVWF